MPDEKTKHTNLSDALAAAQAEFTPVPKNKTAKVQTKTGGTYFYKYADIADVLKMALPILGKNGLAFSQPLRRADGKLYLVSRLSFGMDDVLESDGLEIPNDLEDPQKFGVWLTYWRRYDGCSLLGIAPDEDTDGEAGSTSKATAKSVPDSKPASTKRTPEKTETEPARQTTVAPAAQTAAPPPKDPPIPSSAADDLIPDGDQRKAYALAAQAFVPNKDDQRRLKDVLLKQTGKSDVSSVTHNEWRAFLKSVNVAAEAKKLDEFLGKTKSNVDPDF